MNIGVKINFEKYRDEKACGLGHQRHGNRDGAREQGIYGGNTSIK